MKFRRCLGATSVIGTAVFMMASNASATPLTFNTNAPGTAFSGGGLSLTSSSGASATLSFVADPGSTIGIPSNVNFGNFTLACSSCGTQSSGIGATFSAFTFNLVVTDVTDGSATGKFVGTSAGGTIFQNVSPITINWAPLVVGPGTTNALTGSFGPTSFTTTNPTGIVAPNSGAEIGSSTVQGFINSTAIPEPATLSLVGGSLLGLGLLRRKKTFRL